MITIIVINIIAFAAMEDVCPDELCHHPSQTCTNDSGQWKCICAHGFKLLGKSCENAYECNTPGYPINCDTNAICVETYGSYKCECKTGFEGNGTVCTGIPCPEDMCSAPSEKCISNDSSGWKCECNDGFERVGKTCETINECSSNRNLCHRDADCIDTYGSYQCKCRHGFHGNRTHCEDLVSACAHLDPCDEEKVCIQSSQTMLYECEKEDNRELWYWRIGVILVSVAFLLSVVASIILIFKMKKNMETSQ